jgi:hypothetical protein
MRVCFTLSTGRQCCINEHGSTVVNGEAGGLVAEEEFHAAQDFEVVSLFSGETRTLSREQLCTFAQTHSAPRGRAVPTVKQVSLLQSLQ